MTKVPKSKVQQIVDMCIKQEGKCFYCKKSFTEVQVTIDHKDPLSRGGTTKEGNLVLACQPCNSEKAGMTEGEYTLAKSLLAEGKIDKKDIPEYVRYVHLKMKFEPTVT